MQLISLKKINQKEEVQHKRQELQNKIQEVKILVKIQEIQEQKNLQEVKILEKVLFRNRAEQNRKRIREANRVQKEPNPGTPDLTNLNFKKALLLW